MSKTIGQLQETAGEAATTRGHVLRWHTSHTIHGKRRAGFANCRKCNAEVQVLTHPAPNEIDIGGEAVALDCPGQLLPKNPA